MASNFSDSSIWKNLEDSDIDSEFISQQKENLRVLFRKFRERTAHLVGNIANELPCLTVHDITHLDALWETADLIAGDNYPFTPLEVFILGGAILLHDSGLCFEAYEGGQAGLRSTIEWKDSYELELARGGEAEVKSEIENRSDFIALRTLHAKQAQKLALMGWAIKDSSRMYLIDDFEIRKRYGSLIGKIAASHHWSIERVASELSNQVNASGSMPREWRVDPIKIACLLRCADAAHIDERRAPDFLYALTRRKGVSADHWKAQNWLNRIDVDQQDTTGSSLIITSSQDFGPDDADAWWIAYDAANLFDMELRASNALLASRKLTVAPPFKAQKLAAATSPELMSSYITTYEWEPRAAKLHVSNIEQLISRIGGTSLYGDGDSHHVFSVAIRELVQNARDAVVARQNIDSLYEGCISVTLRNDPNDPASWWIDVEDDGVGMSENVLTGPLLDFGSSFWTSSLLQEEFPGLRSSRFRSVGKFGVGFYSVFMIANSVKISSRKYEEGLTDVKMLIFPTGLTLRPILKRGRPSGFSASCSTRISLQIKSEINWLPDVEIQRHFVGAKNFRVKFPQFLSALVAGCDVNIYCRINSEDFIHVHRPLKDLATNDDRKGWLQDISFASEKTNIGVRSKIERDHTRLRPIVQNGEVVGLAALSIEAYDYMTFLSGRTIGGFLDSVGSRGSTTYVGVLDHAPRSAKRDASQKPIIKQELLRAWANDQLEILRALKIDPIHWVSCSYALCDLNLDPLPSFHILAKTSDALSVFDVDSLFSLFEEKSLAVFKSEYHDVVETSHNQEYYKSIPLFWPLRNGNFLSLDMENGKPSNPFSFLGCIFRHADVVGKTLTLDLKRNVAPSHFGRMDALIISIVR